MTDTTPTDTKLTFERLMEVLAEKIADRVRVDSHRLYPRLLTIAQAAAYLGLQADEVERLIARRRISTVRIDRRILLDRDYLDQWIKDNKLGWA